MIPMPKTKTTFNSFSNPSKETKEKEGDNQFQPPRKNPTSRQNREILALAVSAAIKCCLENHYYMFDGKLWKQRDGGAIGSDLTGEVTRVVMLR